MDIAAWLTAASADAERRGLPALTPLLETLARSTTALREADLTSRTTAPVSTSPVTPDTGPERGRG